MPDEAGGDGCLVQNGAFERRQLPCAQPAGGALAGDAADLRRGLQITGRSRNRIPVVALHRAVLFADHGTVDAVARTGVAAGKAMGVGVYELRLVQRYRGAVRVGETAIDTERRRFALESKRNRSFDREVPWMVQVEVGPAAGRTWSATAEGASAVSANRVAIAGAASVTAAASVIDGLWWVAARGDL